MGLQRYRIEFLPKLSIGVFVIDEDIPVAISAIIMGARTGDIRNGKIFIMPVENTVNDNR